MSLLANLITIIHVVIVIFTIIGPFSNNKNLLIVYTALAFSLINHWSFNDDTCCLTVIENKISGSESSFIHKIVSPIYKISNEVIKRLSTLYVSLALAYTSYKLGTMGAI